MRGDQSLTYLQRSPLGLQNVPRLSAVFLCAPCGESQNSSCNFVPFVVKK